MSKKTKTEFNNQWANSLNDLTSKSESKQKNENNNQWTSTLKNSSEAYLKGSCSTKNKK